VEEEEEDEEEDEDEDEDEEEDEEDEDDVRDEDDVITSKLFDKWVNKRHDAKRRSNQMYSIDNQADAVQLDLRENTIRKSIDKWASRRRTRKNKVSKITQLKKLYTYILTQIDIIDENITDNNQIAEIRLDPNRLEHRRFRVNQVCDLAIKYLNKLKKTPLGREFDAQENAFNEGSWHDYFYIAFIFVYISLTHLSETDTDNITQLCLKFKGDTYMHQKHIYYIGSKGTRHPAFMSILKIVNKLVLWFTLEPHPDITSIYGGNRKKCVKSKRSKRGI